MVFQRYVVCLRRDAMIEIVEACVHYLFITIVTACFLPLGGIDYICYGAHVLYRVGTATVSFRNPLKPE